jgi:hypothetical protein
MNLTWQFDYINLLNDNPPLLYFTVPHTFPWSAHGVLMELPICVREVMYKFLC